MTDRDELGPIRTPTPLPKVVDAKFRAVYSSRLSPGNWFAIGGQATAVVTAAAISQWWIGLLFAPMFLLAGVAIEAVRPYCNRDFVRRFWFWRGPLVAYAVWFVLSATLLAAFVILIMHPALRMVGLAR